MNVLKVKEARLLTGEQLQARVLDAAGFDYRPHPSLFEELPEEAEVTVADLEEQGIRVRPEPDPELKQFLEITRKINDEEEEFDEPLLPAKVVADARGLRATDPVLDKFLQ